MTYANCILCLSLIPKFFCRECKCLNHAPLKCPKSDAVESRSKTRERLHIEESISEALIRECWKCDTPFIKEGGCNFITCTCGAFNCYVCKRRIDSYDHFGEESDGRYWIILVKCLRLFYTLESKLYK